MLSGKKVELAYNARRDSKRKNWSQTTSSSSSINSQKSVLNKHFKKQLNGLEKGGQLTNASQSNAIETVIMIIYYGSYVAEALWTLFKNVELYLYMVKKFINQTKLKTLLVSKRNLAMFTVFRLLTRDQDYLVCLHQRVLLLIKVIKL